MIDFDGINDEARKTLLSLLAQWLPDGRKEGRWWVARNPCRNDRHAGSFKVDMKTGKWADYAINERGGDPVSLLAYLEGIGQGEAARKLADMLGVE